MTDAEGRQFAVEWIRNFNARDLDAVLAYFADDVEFTSPRAVAITGKATVHFRRELADYWRTSLKSVESLRFTLDHVINDEAAGRMTIVYISEIDGRKVRAAEFFEFDSSGMVIRGEAMHGATVA
ncbi:MAG TPA: nuclear transport factor 2 family protein [Terriglobia bacterium]|nr:nuclear transport factor 2 family protein [Terriglobia bacterium]